MCDPVTIGLILSATGSGIGAYNNYQTAKRQDKAAAAGIQRAGKKQQEANARVNEEIAATNANNGEAQKQQAMQGYLNALRQAQPVNTGTLRDVPGTNARFAEDVSAGRRKINADATAEAGRMSRINAPVNARQRDADRRLDTVGDLRETQRQLNAGDMITRLDVADQRPNEFLSVLSAALKTAGGVTGMSGQIPFGIGQAGTAAAATPFAAGTNPFLASIKAAAPPVRPVIPRF